VVKGFLVAPLLAAAVLGTCPALEAPEAGALAIPYSESGHTPKPAGIQTFAIPGYSFGDPTPQEQLTLELINRARANPAAEATRLGINLNQGLPPGTISSTPKPPLTFEQALLTAAREHSQWMLDTDTFSHTGTNGTNAKQRMENAGYPFTGNWSAGENIAWKGTTGTVNLNAYTTALYEQLFLSPDHRVNILSENFDQIGVGLKEGQFSANGTDWNTVMVTQDFARSSSSPVPEGPFVTGVVFRDLNGNGFYDIGEGLGGVTAKLVPGDTTATTSLSGGYAIPLGTDSGSIYVIFSGGELTEEMIVPAVVMPGISVKADLVLPANPSKVPVISLSGDLNFGSVTVGKSVTRKLTISNTGKAPLIITGLTHSDSAFSGNFSGKIAAGRKQKVTITFRPEALQTYSGTITVLSNAGGMQTLEETGTGVAAPVVETPVISPDGGTFSTKKIKVSIKTATPKAKIRYTTDGSEPTESSPKAPKKIRLKESTVLKAKAFRAGYTESATATAEFLKVP
jgi:Uncharacterized protein with SCP/PR1 domains